MFICKKCGKCCRNIDLIVPEFDRGDGICRDYDDETKLCKIYEIRPLVCRAKEMYEKLYKDRVDEVEYYKFIQFMCKNFERRN